MGEVSVPGTYRLSSFSSVFHALYRAGGITEIGSLRNINVIRKRKKIKDIDIYDYLLHGNTSDDIRLQEGDVIIVPPYSILVNIEGNVKRPMYYEMKKDEHLDNLIKYAGDFLVMLTAMKYVSFVVPEQKSKFSALLTINSQHGNWKTAISSV